jgi:hypothetical protein
MVLGRIDKNSLGASASSPTGNTTKAAFLSILKFYYRKGLFRTAERGALRGEVAPVTPRARGRRKAGRRGSGAGEAVTQATIAPPDAPL